jgi:aspartate aminotransferase-like enzyme
MPVIIGEDEKAFQMCRILYDYGIFTTPIVSPAVPPGRALIRVSIMATHTDEHLDRTLEAFENAGRELGIIDTNRPWIKKRRFSYNVFNMKQLRNWMGKIWR